MLNVISRISALLLQSRSKRVMLAVNLSALVCIASSSHASNETTLILNDPTEAPYTTVAGDGFFDKIAGEAFRRAGLHLKLVKLPPERGLMNANNGIEDGDLSRIAGLEKKYPNLVRIPEKLIDMDFVAFSRKSTPVKATWASLEPFPVGYIKGWKIFETNLLPSANFITADDPEQLFTTLYKDRIDIALYDRWMGMELARKLHIEDVHVVEPPLTVREMFIYLNKKHASKIPAIVAALRAIKAEGTYAKVCREKFALLSKNTPQCEVK